jgi:hypothetical protein
MKKGYRRRRELVPDFEEPSSELELVLTHITLHEYLQQSHLKTCRRTQEHGQEHLWFPPLSIRRL